MAKKKEKGITLHKNASGTESYLIQIMYKGQKFRKSIAISDFPDKKSALKYACRIRDEKRAEMEAGYKVSNVPTVRQLFEDSYNDLKSCSLGTKSAHEKAFKGCLEKFGDTRIDKITLSDIQGYLNDYADGHSDDRIKRVLYVWKRIFKTAIRQKIAVHDLTADIEKPDSRLIIEPKEKKNITTADIEKFCDALLAEDLASVRKSYRNYSLYLAIRVMQYCGLRPQEVFALAVDDVDLITGKISINKAVRSTRKDAIAITTTKTKESIRKIPINDALRPYLIEARDRAKNGYLFTDYGGNLLGTNENAYIIGKIAKKAGVPHFHLYALRHAFSSDLFNANVPAHVIRDAMGHKNSSMSLEYAISSEEDIQKAVQNRIFS